MIREKFNKDIINRIDKHQRFDNAEFIISATKNGSSTILVITYKFKPEYRILFNVPSTSTTDKDGYSPYYAFSGKVSPGPLAYEETFSFKGEGVLFDKIDIWLNSIWEEISSSPIVKQVENQQTKIDEILENFDSLDDKFFTLQEAEDLKTRLDELEETLKELIINHVHYKENKEEELSRLHLDIDTLKQTVNSFNKKGWVKSFVGKMFKWTSDEENKKLLQGGYSFVKQFLPENIK
ncbi:MAG: hypothetical protein WC615_21240, partial [Mucilaginibacter sp.]|uniref:hypothetical protein n=1 Tax=Mucilaginibacter sp. TaxID=1882438 RepID=UPI0035661D35